MAYALSISLIPQSLFSGKLRDRVHACIPFDGWTTSYGAKE